MEVFRSDAKTGLFILVGLILFLFVLFRVGGLMEQWKPGLEIMLRFADAQQLEVGAEVYFRGLKVGRVKSLNFSDDGQSVAMSCRLTASLVLHEGTEARIVDKSVLGGKVVELLAPAPLEGQALQILGEGSEIQGLPAGGLTATLELINDLIVDYRSKLDGLVAKFETLLDNLNTTTQTATTSIKSFAGSKETLTKTMDAYRNLASSLSDDMSLLAQKMEHMINFSEGRVDGLARDFTVLTANLQQEITSVTQGLNLLLDNSNKLVGNSNDMLAENRESLTTSLASLKLTLANLEIFSAKVAERPSSLIWKGRKQKLDKSK